MAVRRSAAGTARGGWCISAPRLRLSAAAGAIVALAAAGALAVGAGRLAAVEMAGVALALALLLTGLAFRRGGTIPWAVACCAVAYVVGRAGHATADARAAALGVLLLLAAELAWWSIDLNPRLHVERALVRTTGVALAGLVAGALVLDAFLLALTGITPGSRVTLAALGMAAAVAVLALVLRGGRR